MMPYLVSRGYSCVQLSQSCYKVLRRGIVRGPLSPGRRNRTDPSKPAEGSIFDEYLHTPPRAIPRPLA